MNHEVYVKEHAAELVKKLVADALSKESIEIHFNFEDDDQWSYISMHIYEEDQEISLRVHSAKNYELWFGYYDEEDEFFETTHTLTPEEKKGIPKELQKAMEKVVNDEQGMRLPGNLLSK